MDGGDYRATLIVNPTAGQGKAARRTPQLVSRLQAGGREVTVQFTRSLEHAGELAQAAVQASRLAVAVGGDGLVSAVANAVAEQPNAVMALVPQGRGNDFARALGITSLDRAVEILDRGHVGKVDLGYIGGQYFTCIASVGFDSRVMEVAQKTRFIRGHAVYHYATLRALLSWQPTGFDIQTDGVQRHMVGYSVAVANGGYFGGGMNLAPDASMTDGLFDVVTIAEVSKPTFLRQGLKVFHGAHLGHSAISVTRARHVVLAADAPFTIYADGEPVGPVPMVAEVRPGALSILI